MAMLVALVLFKVFSESTTVVAGPLDTAFGELKLKASGAIGGFLVVFIIMVLITPNINKSVINQACGNAIERWTFSVPGYIFDANQNGSFATSYSDLRTRFGDLPRKNPFQNNYTITGDKRHAIVNTLFPRDITLNDRPVNQAMLQRVNPTGQFKLTLIKNISLKENLNKITNPQANSWVDVW